MFFIIHQALSYYTIEQNEKVYLTSALDIVFVRFLSLRFTGNNSDIVYWKAMLWQIVLWKWCWYTMFNMGWIFCSWLCINTNCREHFLVDSDFFHSGVRLDLLQFVLLYFYRLVSLCSEIYCAKAAPLTARLAYNHVVGSSVRSQANFENGVFLIKFSEFSVICPWSNSSLRLSRLYCRAPCSFIESCSKLATSFVNRLPFYLKSYS